MRQPDFWFQPPGLLSFSLAPLSAVWNLAVRARLKRGRRCAVGAPVICVGNLNVGGTGKTPFAVALIQRLIDAGETPHAISRGYGGSIGKATAVDPNRHAASDVGDEALLLASFAPTWIGGSRLDCASLAVKSGASVIVLDDGHQDPSLVHDLAIVIVDAFRGFGNGRTMPAGPLREPVAEGLRRADQLVVVGGSPDEFRTRWPLGPELDAVEATLAVLPTGQDWNGERVLAFAGIGDPGKFFAQLSALGAEIVKAVPLSDHQPLRNRLLERLQREAESHEAQLVTTEKDAVRLPQPWRRRVLTLPVRMTLSDWSPIDRRLVGIGLQVPGKR